MAENLTDTQKYDYIKQKYGKDADKILKRFGAFAYDIDKAIPVDAQRMGGDKNKKYFQDIWESQLRAGQYALSSAIHLLKNNENFKGKTSSDQYNLLHASADAYKAYAKEQAKAAEEAKKITYIRQKYGEKADIMLQTYGAMAYDIDENFNKFYNKGVFFGRNYWLDSKGLQKRGAEGRKNKELFEAGKLPLAEAARIINCPAYFGTMDMTINKISGQIKQSATTYKAQYKPDSKPTARTVTPKEQPALPKEPEKTKVKPKENKKTVKQELKNQRTVADMKPTTLNEVIVTASPTPQQKKLDDRFLFTSELEAAKVEINKADIKIKSPAEQKYEELLTKKTAKMPDVMGRKAQKVGLTIGELMDLGVDPKGDFQTILKNMGEKERAAAEALIPKEGFKDKNVVVSKELAIAAIERVQIREIQKKLGKERA